MTTTAAEEARSFVLEAVTQTPASGCPEGLRTVPVMEPARRSTALTPVVCPTGTESALAEPASGASGNHWSAYRFETPQPKSTRYWPGVRPVRR